jgi:hypothetical protein
MRSTGSASGIGAGITRITKEGAQVAIWALSPEALVATGEPIGPGAMPISWLLRLTSRSRIHAADQRSVRGTMPP